MVNTPGAKVVLVTGGTGYIGTEIIKQLLDRGYQVRAAVRKVSPDSTGHLSALAEALPGQLDLVEVPDILADQAYDGVVPAADYVIHSASPLNFGTGDSREDQKHVVDPAVKGITNMLESVARVGKATVKRVVWTSSTATVIPSSYSGDKVFTESDWDNTSTLENGVYNFSKVQAEKAALAAALQHQIDFIAICPSLVIGPFTGKRGGMSSDIIAEVAEGGSWGGFFTTRLIDVRDVALAHIRAIETPSAKGRYILCHSHTHNLRDLQTVLEEEFPNIQIPEAEVSQSRPVVDSSRAQKEFGMTFIPATRAIIDSVRTQLQLGIAEPTSKPH